jgi:restriction endonuclease S subunit
MRTNDVLMPSPIGSTKGVIIVPSEYDGQLCSTGFVQFKNNSYEEALILFAVLKSTLIQRYLYCVQSGCIQPSVSTNTLINDIVLPIPIGKYKKELLTKIKEYVELAMTLYSQIFLMKQDLIKQFESDIRLLLETAEKEVQETSWRGSGGVPQIQNSPKTGG